MRQILSLTVLLLFLAITSWADGQEAFLKNCKSCHKAGGIALSVNPTDKAAVVWKKYFKRKRHPIDISSISADDMQAILRYLQDHAADSDHPEAAAIPR